MSQKLTIEELQKIADSHGGSCLSDEYVNNYTNLLWECDKGHEWWATPKNIIHGSWCRLCAFDSYRLGLAEMQELAKSRGGICLSDKYINGKTKLLWQCDNGHRWWASPLAVKAKTWCPVCAGKLPLSITDMQAVAESHDGKCLSEEYVNIGTKLLWQCDKGHQWEATPSNVIYGKTWCAVCKGQIKHTIKDMQHFAESRGGKCLSEKYVNNLSKLHWQCAQGHEWWAKPNAIQQGQWCPVCSGKLPLGLKEMQELAMSRGGRCLSEEYVNGNTKLLWQCDKGHEWWASPLAVKAKTWCPTCAGNVKLELKELHELAESRGGRCLSEEYVNSESKLLWECYRGHRWEARSASIRAGGWCPECSAGTGEKICRAFFEQLFKMPFPKTRPDWLRNSRGNKMELDGFNEEIRLAFEHQGKQHFMLKHHFVTTRQQLQQRAEDDELKIRLCEKEGIVLLQVPEIPTLLPLTKVKQFIKDECVDNGIKLPHDFDETEINLNETYNQGYLREIQAIAESRGGKCLTETFIHSHEKIKLICAKGHIWSTKAYQIKTGRWCPICAGTVPLKIEKMQEVAKIRGGKCLSDRYINIKTKLLWQCAEGHEWEATPGNVITNKSWCPTCYKLNHTNKVN